MSPKKIFQNSLHKLSVALLCALLVTLSSCTRDSNHRANGNKIVVLAYHQIDNNLSNLYTVTPQVFVNQTLSLLDRGYVSINSDDYYAWRMGDKTLPPKCFMLTFDDGYESDYQIVYPILKKMNLRATFFPVASQIDSPGSLSTKQLRDMAMDERCAFGSHTFNHKVLPLLDTEELKRELLDSRLFLEKITGKKTISLAYPFGAWNEATITIARDVGYNMAFTIIGGVNESSTDLFRLRRILPNNSFEGQDWVGITDFDPKTYHYYYSDLLERSKQAGHKEIADICSNELQKLVEFQ